MVYRGRISSLFVGALPVVSEEGVVRAGRQK